MLQVEDADKFPQTLGFESLDPFFFLKSLQAGSTEEDEGDKRLVQLELVSEADVVALPDPI